MFFFVRVLLFTLYLVYGGRFVFIVIFNACLGRLLAADGSHGRQKVDELGGVVLGPKVHVDPTSYRLDGGTHTMNKRTDQTEITRRSK